MIEAISGMQDSLIDIDQRGIRLQQAINFCAAHAEIILQKEGGRDAVASMWKSINIRTGISQSQDKREGDEPG